MKNLRKIDRIIILNKIILIDQETPSIIYTQILIINFEEIPTYHKIIFPAKTIRKTVV